MSESILGEYGIRGWKVVLHRDRETPKETISKILVETFHLFPEHADLFADVIRAAVMADGADEARRVQFGPFTREVAEHLTYVVFALAAQEQCPLQASFERE